MHALSVIVFVPPPPLPWFRARFAASIPRFSPFGRTTNATSQVTDQDFSYITSEDIQRQKAEAKALFRKIARYNFNDPSAAVSRAEAAKRSR